MGKNLNNAKKSPRERRKIRVRKVVTGASSRPRVCVFRSDKHIYAQLIDDSGSSRVLASASTLEKDVKDQIGSVAADGLHSQTESSKGLRAAKAVGLVLGKRAMSKDVSRVVFDRNGYLYHGRIKAVADGARESGLQF